MIQVVCSFLRTFERATWAILPWHATAEQEPAPFKLEANVAVAAGGEGSTVCAWFRTQPGKISTSKGMMLLGFRRIRVVTVWELSIGENLLSSIGHKVHSSIDSGFLYVIPP